MSRERVFPSLQQAAYILNLAAVCLVAGSMAYSIQAVVDAMEAEAFLELVRVRPWKPQTMLATALICYLCLVFLSCLGQLWEHKRRALRNTVMVLEMLFCIGATVAMNMDYNGLVLLVVADMVRGQKGSKQKVVLGVAIVGLYTIVNHNLTGAYFNMIPWEQFLTAYGASTQAFLRGTLSVFSSMNLVLFILYMTMLIQGEYRERERIQNLNDQLEEANQKLKEYAAEAEKNAEMRERNRLAREIHDTLGHALTGIVAGIDASLTELSFEEYSAAIQKGNYDLYIGEIRLTADMNLEKVLPSGEAANAYGQYQQGEIDLQAFLTAFSQEQPMVPLCYRQGAVAFTRELKGTIAPAFSDPYRGAKDWTFGG